MKKICGVLYLFESKQMLKPCSLLYCKEYQRNSETMSEHGACLQTYNQELVKCLEDLKSQQQALSVMIKKEESEEAVLQRNISILQEKLNSVQSNLKYHRQICDDYTKTIQDTETGFKKILESSQTLLNLAQHQSKKLKNIR